MFPLDLVTEVEKNAIKDHIDNNAESELQTSVDYILREWNEKKNSLFNTIFNGNKLILEKEVCFKKDYESIVSSISNAWDDMPADANNFVNDFEHFINVKRNECWGNIPRWAWTYNKENMAKESEWYNCNLLISNSVLASNAVNQEFTVELPKEDGTFRSYKVQIGSKPMRVLSKINQAYHFSSEENYKAFCTWHSQILNDRSIKGKFCLSIHPLDYMTMSQNTHGWSSCMNWDDDGCYRAGTVEMMNSPMVIVVYLKSDNAEMPMTCGWERKDGKAILKKMNWNSKKWRTLIIVDKSGIYSVKAYPYQHEEMTKYAMKWINELCGEKYVKEPVKFKPYDDSSVFYNDKEYIYNVNPRTFRMYNDFGSTTHYMMPAIEELEDMEKTNNRSRTFNILYSGASECMSCGGLNYNNDYNGVDFDSEENLVCNNCNPDIENYYCEECGCSITNEDEVIWVGDISICPDCYNRVCYEDHWSGEPAFKDGGIIDLVIKEDGKKYYIGNVIPWNVPYWVNSDVVARVQNFIDKLDDRKKRLILNAEDLNQRGSLHFQGTKEMMEFKRRYA